MATERTEKQKDDKNNKEWETSRGRKRKSKRKAEENAGHVDSRASTMLKPLALIRWRGHEHTMGMVPSHERLIAEHFRVLTLAEVQQTPKLLSDVQAVFMIPFNSPAFVPLVSKMPRLRVLATASAGYNHMYDYPLQELEQRGVKMTYSPGIVDDTTADMCMALLLAAARNIVRGASNAMGTTMPVFSMNDFGLDVSGTTLGIVGMGSIGLEVAKRAHHGFNMDVLYHNRNRRPQEIEDQVSATYHSSVHTMLPLCDYVVITCALTPLTTRMFSQAEFKLMKATACIVNIARGAVVDHIALAEALSNHIISAAALDVTDPEPLPRDHPLLTCDGCLITPHYGSGTLRTRLRMLQAVVDDSVAAIQGKPLQNELKL